MSKLVLTQIYLVAIGLSVLAMLFHIELSDTAGIVGLAVAVTILGLPHGALDFAVAKSLNYVTSGRTASAFLLVYTTVAALSILFWIEFPGVALSLFLCISIFHFSADWRATMPLYARICLAAIVLSGPSVVYASAVLNLFTALLVSNDFANWIIQAMRLIFGLACMGFLYFVILAVKNNKVKSGWQAMEWTGLIISSLLLTPLFHFTLYFCVLHSPKHLVDVSKILSVSFARAIVVSLPFVLLTLILAGVLFKLIATEDIDVGLLRWTFIGLFGLTMSHMLLIHLWHRSKQRF
ncbi:MAG: Brp/Blh family beta-carotene 15,15'-monooxygenase [Glaciecola sp.]